MHIRTRSITKPDPDTAIAAGTASATEIASRRRTSVPLAGANAIAAGIATAAIILIAAGIATVIAIAPGAQPGGVSASPDFKSTAPSALTLTLGPATKLRHFEDAVDQPARVVPGTVVSAPGADPFGMVLNFARYPASDLTRLHAGFAPFGGGAFGPDHFLHATSRGDDLGIGRPDAVMLQSNGDALLAYILNIRGRHDVLFGRLTTPLDREVVYDFAWLNRTDIRAPQQLAFARPADPEAARHLLGFTAFRTDASAGSKAYAALVNPADLSAEVADITPVEYRNCTDIRLFRSTIGPVASARCRRTESTPWRAVVMKLGGAEPWSGSPRLVEPVAVSPDDDAEDVRVLDVDMDPAGRQLTLAWASAAPPARPELEWEARRFDLGAWAPAGEPEPLGGEGVEARVRYLDLAAHGWAEMRAILDVAPDAGVNRGRITLAGRRDPGGELVQGSAWLEPGAVPDGIIPFGAWSASSPTDPPGAGSTPIGLVVYRLDGHLTARRFEVSIGSTHPTPVTTPPTDTPIPDPPETPTGPTPATPPSTPDPSESPTPSTPATPATPPTSSTPPSTPIGGPSATPTSPTTPPTPFEPRPTILLPSVAK